MVPLELWAGVDGARVKGLRIDQGSFWRSAPALALALALPVAAAALVLTFRSHDILTVALLAIYLSVSWKLTVGACLYLFFLVARKPAIWVNDGTLVALSKAVWSLPLQEIRSAKLIKQPGRSGESVRFVTEDGRKHTLISSVFEGGGAAVLELMRVPDRS